MSNFKFPPWRNPEESGCFAGAPLWHGFRSDMGDNGQLSVCYGNATQYGPTAVNELCKATNFAGSSRDHVQFAFTKHSGDFVFMSLVGEYPPTRKQPPSRTLHYDKVDDLGIFCHLQPAHRYWIDVLISHDHISTVTSNCSWGLTGILECIPTSARLRCNELITLVHEDLYCPADSSNPNISCVFSSLFDSAAAAARTRRDYLLHLGVDELQRKCFHRAIGPPICAAAGSVCDASHSTDHVRSLATASRCAA